VPTYALLYCKGIKVNSNRYRLFVRQCTHSCCYNLSTLNTTDRELVLNRVGVFRILYLLIIHLVASRSCLDKPQHGSSRHSKDADTTLSKPSDSSQLRGKWHQQDRTIQQQALQGYLCSLGQWSGSLAAQGGTG